MTLDPQRMDAAVYAHLRSVAGRVHAGAGPGAAIDPTEPLHEAWLKLQQQEVPFADRDHLLRTAALAMRQVLIDRARARAASRHGSGALWLTLPDVSDTSPRADELPVVDAALVELEAEDPRAAEVAALRTFGGLTIPEVAALNLSPRTTNSTWRFARAFLETECTVWTDTRAAKRVQRRRFNLISSSVAPVIGHVRSMYAPSGPRFLPRPQIELTPLCSDATSN